MTEKDGPFPSAQHDLEAAERKQDIPQTRSPSYRLAFADTDLMLRDELRGVRLEVELLKADLALDDAGIESTIVVFGSARGPAQDQSSNEEPHEKADDYEAARRFAQLVAQAPPVAGQRFVIATGGGGGIMEAANRGASDAGEPTIGFNIVLKTEQTPNQFITPELCFQFHYFGLRKMHLLMRARALVCFPGGFGTLDELFEILTLVQTEKVAPMPVLLYRAAWWKQLINFDMLVDQGMISPEDLKIFRFVESADEGWEIIRDYYERGAPSVCQV